MNPTFTVVADNQVYVYVLGQLVMKRWLRTRQCVLFQVAPCQALGLWEKK